MTKITAIIPDTDTGATSAVKLNEAIKDISGESHSDLTLDDGTNPHGTTKADVSLGNADNTSDINKPVSTSTQTAIDDITIPIGFAAGDEDTDIETGTAKITFRMPFAFTLTEVRANLKTAPTDNPAIFDINESGISILSTKLSVDIGEKTSETAVTPPVISDANLADDAEITVDFDQVGTVGAGPKLWLIGKKA